MPDSFQNADVLEQGLSPRHCSHLGADCLLWGAVLGTRAEQHPWPRPHDARSTAGHDNHRFPGHLLCPLGAGGSPGPDAVLEFLLESRHRGDGPPPLPLAPAQHFESLGTYTPVLPAESPGRHGWGLPAPLVPPPAPLPCSASAGRRCRVVCLQTSPLRLFYLRRPRNLSNVKRAKIKRMEWMTDDVFLFPEAAFPVSSRGRGRAGGAGLPGPRPAAWGSGFCFACCFSSLIEV